MNYKILITTLTLVFLATCSKYEDSNYPIVKNGVINLKNWNFKKDGNVKLDGYWEFYWNKKIEPSYFQSSNRFKNDIYIKVPKKWNEKLIKKYKVSKYGFATYYCKILLNKNNSTNNQFAFYLPTSGSAYDLYLNEKKIASAGKFGSSEKTEIPAIKPQIVEVFTKETELNIVMHISNFSQYFAGQWYSIWFGSLHEVFKKKEFRLKRAYFLFGIFLFMSLYYIAFFICNRLNILSLYLAIICFLLALRSNVYEGTVVIDLFDNLSFGLKRKLDYLTFYLVIPAVALFLKASFVKEISKKIVQIIIFLASVFSLIVIFTNVKTFAATLIYYQVIAFISILYGLYVIILAVLRKRDGAITSLVGVIVLSATGINDMLYAQLIIRTGYYVSYGLLFFVLTQSYLISYRFSKTCIHNELLSSELEARNIELQDLNVNLEKKVEERTREVGEINIILKQEIKERKKAESELIKISTVDTLTNVANRFKFNNEIEKSLNKLSRYSGDMSLILLDLDHFKNINDNYGHDVGDEVLKIAANLITETIRKSDLVARWGGEEFVVLLPNTKIQNAIKFAERLRRKMEAYKFPIDKQVTCSLGVTSYSKDDDSITLLKKADEALYKAKETGRNKVIKG